MASDREKGDEFGRSVAISDDYAVLETQKIVASNKESGDWFGESVEIFQDHLVVGDSYKDEVYVFEKDEFGSWN